MSWQMPAEHVRDPQHCAPDVQNDPSYQQQRASPVVAVTSQMAPVTSRLHCAVTWQASPGESEIVVYVGTVFDPPDRAPQMPPAQTSRPQQWESAPQRLPSKAQQLSEPSSSVPLSAQTRAVSAATHWPSSQQGSPALRYHDCAAASPFPGPALSPSPRPPPAGARLCAATSCRPGGESANQTDAHPRQSPSIKTAPMRDRSLYMASPGARSPAARLLPQADPERNSPFT